MVGGGEISSRGVGRGWSGVAKGSHRVVRRDEKHRRYSGCGFDPGEGIGRAALNSEDLLELAQRGEQNVRA